MINSQQFKHLQKLTSQMKWKTCPFEVSVFQFLKYNIWSMNEISCKVVVITSTSPSLIHYVFELIRIVFHHLITLVGTVLRYSSTVVVIIRSGDFYVPCYQIWMKQILPFKEYYFVCNFSLFKGNRFIFLGSNTNGTCHGSTIAINSRAFYVL